MTFLILLFKCFQIDHDVDSADVTPKNMGNNNIEDVEELLDVYTGSLSPWNSMADNSRHISFVKNGKSSSADSSRTSIQTSSNTTTDMEVLVNQV